MTFSIHTYRASENDNLSVYVLSNEVFDIDEAIDYLTENYEYHDSCELIEENEPSVANHLGYKYCAVFHQN